MLGYVNLSYILFGIVEARSLLGLVYLSNKQSQVPIKVRERCIKAIQSVDKKENWSILDDAEDSLVEIVLCPLQSIRFLV